jgi:hypothetical protein
MDHTMPMAIINDDNGDSTSLKEVYDSKFFHGKKNKAEAYELCKEELENTGNKLVSIWFLEEKDGKLREKTCLLFRDSELPTLFYLEDFTLAQRGWWGSGYLAAGYFLTRKIPFPLIELARVSVLDNANYCCMKNLIEGLDELRIPATEKEELKKLVRPFRRRLESKIPNVFSDSESDD